MIPLSVLIVHPDPAVAARIARAVAVAGHAPVLLSDGERAIDRFVQEPADVVVVDYFLPGRDGVATIEAIRWAPGGRDAHVVLIADREPEGTRLDTLGLRIGALFTLVGPVTDSTLGRLVDALSRPPGETTRIASVDEIGGQLERLGMSTSSLDRRALDGELPPPPGARGDAEDDPAAAWPVIETVMAHASADPEGARRPLEPPAAGGDPASGSGVMRRPLDPKSRLTTPPPAMRTADLTPGAGTRAPERFADAAEMEEGRGVGEQARASAEGSQRVMGRFDDVTFAALLRRLADLRATGALVCVAEGSRRETTTGDPPTKVVYFRAGVPVHVRSNLLDECLGQILLRRRRIGAATLEESIRRMRLGHGLQGEILIDMGALAPLELGEALAEQARDKLFDCFGWTRGSYRLSTRLEPPTDAVGIELSLAEIVYEGVCAAMPPTRLFELLSPHLARFVVPDPVQLARFVRVRLVPEARHVLAKVDGALTLREILSMGTRPGAVAQLVYALECLGAVHFSDVPRASSRSGALTGQAPLGGETDEGAETEPPLVGDDPPELARAMLETPQPPRPHRATLPEDGLLPAPLAGMEEWDDTTSPQREREARAGMARADASGMVATPEQEERRDSAPLLSSSEEPPDSEDDPRPLDARVDDLFEAERHFRRGNRALDRGRLEEALAAFSRAYELCPDQGEFLAYVGWARHCLTPEDSASTGIALEELARARELAPEIHVTHLLHARVLATAGRAEEAHGAYLRVLQIDPACAEARDALGGA